MTATPPRRVLFIHGLESNPRGTKAHFFSAHFEALTPAMDTSDFAACQAVQVAAIERFSPDVVVGSSFGGGVAVALLAQGRWRGPTVLLAPASRLLGVTNELPEGVAVTVIHGRRDAIVPLADSRALAATGTPELVRLVEVDDEHRLLSLVEDKSLASLVIETHQRGR